MKERIEYVKQWILKRDTREKIILFFFSLLVIYYGWHLLMMRSLTSAQTVLQDQLQALHSQQQTMQQQIDMIEKITNSPTFKNLFRQQQELTRQGKQIKQKIASFKPVFIVESDIPKLTKDILDQLGKSITLVSLNEFPTQPWKAPEVDQSVIAVQHISEHRLAIAFRGNYFATLAYLQRLETLPWHFYWDSLEYKVTDYPQAEVVVQLYVLSHKKNVS